MQLYPLVRLEAEVCVAAQSDMELEACTVDLALYPSHPDADVNTPLISGGASPAAGHWMAADANSGLRGGLASVRMVCTWFAYGLIHV